jgi:hypothetical protein
MPWTILWWVYFALVTLFISEVLFDAATTDKGLFPFVYIIVVSWALVGLAGFIRGRAIATRIVWVACLSALGLVVLLVTLAMSLAAGIPGLLVSFFGVGVFLAPQLYALHTYAFRSPALWRPRR